MPRSFALWYLCACLLSFLLQACANADEAKGRPVPEKETVRTDALGDPLPPGALLRIGTLRMRHPGVIGAVALSPDGKLVASTGSDKTVRLWSAATGEEVRRLPMPATCGWLNGVAFSPDGTIVAAWLWSVLRLWDVRTGKVLADWEDGGGSFAFSADGKTLVSVRSKTLRFWDVGKRKQTRQFEFPDLVFCGLALSPDARLVACTGGPWKLDSGLQFRVGVYEAATGKEVWKSPVPRMDGAPNFVAPPQEVTFSPDGKSLAVASFNEPVYLFEAQTGRKRDTIGMTATCIAYSPDGTVLALGFHSNRSITLWDVAAKKPLRRLNGHGSMVTSLAFSRDGKTLVSGSHDGSVRLWDVATGKEKQTWPGHQYRLFSLAYLPGGRGLVSHGSDHTVRLWDAASGKELRRLTLVPPSQLGPEYDFRYHDTNRYLHSLAVSPDGKTVAVCDPRRSLHLWDMTTGKEKCLLKGQRDCWVTFAPDGKTLASADQIPAFDEARAVVRLWDANRGGLQKTFPVPPGLWGLLFMPDGKALVTGLAVLGKDGKISRYLGLHDASSGKELRRWPLPPQAGGFDLALAPDGQTFAAGGVWSEKEKNPILLGDTQAGAVRRLSVLYCARTKVSNLSPLKGMPLTWLDCSLTDVSDLTPLIGMPLRQLFCGGS